METFMAKKKRQISRPATESQESDTTLIKAPLPLSSMQSMMMIKAMKMNKLSYWKLHLMLVKVKSSDSDVTRESMNAYYPLKDSDAEMGRCTCYWQFSGAAQNIMYKPRDDVPGMSFVRDDQ